LERSYVPGNTEHLIHFAGMQFLGIDHLSGVFLKHHRTALRKFEQLPIEGERLALGFQRFAQDRANVVLVVIKQGTDLILSDG
jgi:hypothetical protein